MGRSPSVSDLVEESYALERAGDVGAALRRAREALKKARVSGEAEPIAIAQICLAYLHFRQGHYDTAHALAEESLGRLPPDAPPRADALLILGNCAAETDDPSAAETFYRRAIDLSRQLGYRRALRRGLHNLAANVYVPRGQFDLALAADEESLRLARELDMPEVAWFPLATMGWVYWVTGRRERALAVTEELRRYAPPGSLAEGFYYCLRADLAQGGEDPDAALPLYTRARSIAETIGDPGLNVLIRLGLSRYRRAAGDASAARDWANDALTIAARVGYRHLQGMALIERGRASWDVGHIAAAESDLRAAIEILSPLQANLDLARGLLLLAALLHQQQRAAAPAAWLEAVSHIISGGYAFLLEQERGLAFPLLAARLNSADPAIASLSARLLGHLANVPPPPLRIVTLGRFEVRQGARVIPDQAWRRRRAGELFRLLLVSPGRSLLRDQVTEALWPGKSPTSTRTPFHQATSALRRALEPDLPEKFPSRYLEVERGLVTLRLPPGSWVDFEAFKQHFRRGEWEAAVSLYRGELFPGDRYADWAASPRRRMLRRYIRSLLALARQCLEAGRPYESLEHCRLVLEVEPWQENAVLLGMRACLALNDRAGALRLYLDLERALREELDIAPLDDLQDLYRRILAQEH